MIRYFKNSKSLTLIFALLILSCTSVDDNLGSGLVPPEDKFEISIETIDNGFEIRSIAVDSMIADISKSYYLGSTIFPRMGRLDASFVTQVAVGVLPDTKVFPADIVVDSAFMILGQSGYIGQTGYELNMNVYELKKKLPYPKDSIYYSNFPIKDYIGSTPDLTAVLTAGEAIYVRMDPSSVVKYMKATKEQNQDAKLFNDAFFGYYFKTNTTFGGGMLSNINTTSSGIKIYYRETPSSKITKEYTLTFAHIVDNESTGLSEIICEGFSFFDRDYSYVSPEFNFDPASTTKSYVMGLEGLITEIKIPQEPIDKIRQIVNANANNILGVLRADLIVPIADTSIGSLNNSIPSLGLYYDYQDFKFMPSYTSSNQDALGGSLNRVKGEYTFNITSYMQGLIRDKENNFTLQVAPKVGDTFTFQSSELANTTERPIKLVVTYTTNK